MKGGKTWAERAPMRSSACHTERTAGGTTGGHARPGRSLVKTEARPEKLSPQQPRLSAGSSVPSVSSSLKRKDSFALNWLSKNKDFIIRYLWHCLSTPSVAICLPQMMDRMCVKCQRFPGHTGFPSPPAVHLPPLGWPPLLIRPFQPCNCSSHAYLLFTIIF